MTVEMQESVQDQETGVQSAESQAAEIMADEAEKADVPPAPAEGKDKAPSEPAFEPNFKFKVYDEEKEFPEIFRGVVKDKTTEEEVRTILSKAFGLDGLKPKYEKTKAERDEVSGKYERTVQGLKKLDHFAKNDLDSFFELTGIQQDKLFDYVQQKLKYGEMSPEERQRHDQARDAQRKVYTYEEQTANLQRQNQELMVQRHNFEVQTAMSDPEISQFAAEFDRRAGKSGAFKEHVDAYGDRMYQVQQQYIQPTQAVRAVFDQYKGLIGYNPLGQQAQAPQTQAPQAKAPPAAIPNIGSGRTVSPTSKRPKSIEELRALIAKQYPKED